MDTLPNADVKAEWTSSGKEPHTLTCLQNHFGLVFGKENGQSIRRELWSSSGRCKALVTLQLGIFSTFFSRLFEVLVDQERMLWLFSCGKGRYISRILYSNWSIKVIGDQIFLFNEHSTVYWPYAVLVLCLVYFSLSSNNKIISTYIINRYIFNSSLQSSVSCDPSEIILICWFCAQETFDYQK